MKSWISRWGLSGVRKSSVGSQFMTKVWKHFFRIISIRRNKRNDRTTHSSSSNGAWVHLIVENLSFTRAPRWRRVGAVEKIKMWLQGGGSLQTCSYYIKIKFNERLFKPQKFYLHPMLSLWYFCIFKVRRDGAAAPPRRRHGAILGNRLLKKQVALKSIICKIWW